MVTARPKPTAAGVLREHPAWSANTEPGYWVTVCDGCGQIITRSRDSSARDDDLARHQADMLAAAGLLATAEHDQAVIEQYRTSPPKAEDVGLTIWGADTLAEHDAQVAAQVAELYRLAPRFWHRVAVGRPSECWPWTGPVVGMGHGRYDSPAGDVAHRYAWAMHYGRLPSPEEVIRHKCDNPICCNPSHLLVGTQQQNVDDMIDRGRGRHERNKCLKGHEFTTENTLIRGGGRRRCKRCTLDGERKRREHQTPAMCPVCEAVFTVDYNMRRHFARFHDTGA